LVYFNQKLQAKSRKMLGQAIGTYGHDIIRDTGGMNSEMSGDVVNIFRRHEICYTPADP